jgi:hypothetical protein
MKNHRIRILIALFPVPLAALHILENNVPDSIGGDGRPGGSLLPYIPGWGAWS